MSILTSNSCQIPSILHIILGDAFLRLKFGEKSSRVFKTTSRVATLSVQRIAARAKQERNVIMIPSIKRGDIFYADLSPVIGSEQGGLRPVLIIQNDIGNKYSPTVIAAAITSKMDKAKLPTHIDINADRVGLAKDSVILLEQIRTLDKRRLKEKMGHLDSAVMSRVNNALAISCGLGTVPDQYGITTEGEAAGAVAAIDSATANGTHKISLT